MYQKRRRVGDHTYTEEGKPLSVVLRDQHITFLNKPKKARVVTTSYGVKRADHPSLSDPPLGPPKPATNIPVQATEPIASDNGAKTSNVSEDPPQSKKVSISF